MNPWCSECATAVLIYASLWICEQSDGPAWLDVADALVELAERLTQTTGAL